MSTIGGSSPNHVPAGAAGGEIGAPIESVPLGVVVGAAAGVAGAGGISPGGRLAAVDPDGAGDAVETCSPVFGSTVV